MIEIRLIILYFSGVKFAQNALRDGHASKSTFVDTKMIGATSASIVIEVSLTKISLIITFAAATPTKNPSNVNFAVNLITRSKTCLTTRR
jgi:hypothetical protein